MEQMIQDIVHDDSIIESIVEGSNIAASSSLSSSMIDYLNPNTKRSREHRKKKRIEKDNLTEGFNKGIVITPHNPSLEGFMASYFFTLNHKKPEGYEHLGIMINDQHEYRMDDHESFYNILKPFITEEIKLVQCSLNTKAPIHLKSIKLTQNYNVKSNKWVCCKEQIPHIDAINNHVRFLVIAVSKSAKITNVYGTQEELLNLNCKQEFDEYFNANEIKIERGQCAIFNPWYIHSGPEIDCEPRVLMYLEYSQTVPQYVEYKVKTIYELRKHENKDNQEFNERFENEKSKRGWLYAMTVTIKGGGAESIKISF